jgi:hypothetical protein
VHAEICFRQKKDSHLEILLHYSLFSIIIIDGFKAHIQMAMDDTKRPDRSGRKSQSSRCGPAEVNVFLRMQTDTAKDFTKVTADS